MRYIISTKYTNLRMKRVLGLEHVILSLLLLRTLIGNVVTLL